MIISQISIKTHKKAFKGEKISELFQNLAKSQKKSTNAYIDGSELKRFARLVRVAGKIWEIEIIRYMGIFESISGRELKFRIYTQNNIIFKNLKNGKNHPVTFYFIKKLFLYRKINLLSNKIAFRKYEAYRKLFNYFL